MKAFEAQKSSKQARYEKIMKEINVSIKEGKNMHTFSSWSYPHLADSFIDEIIEMIQEDGFDVKLYYNVYDQLEHVTISWENSKEGKRGVLTITKKDKTPKEKPSFWKRFCDFFESDGDDGTW